MYQNIHLFLTKDDYIRMDSLLVVPGFMDARLEDDLNALMLPSGSFFGQNISRDPLGLFAPVLDRLRQSRQQMPIEVRDGYIFSPDRKQALVMLPSPFGSSETRKNARLISLLEDAAEEMRTDFPQVRTRITGGPAIAVGNARQIMRDSILAVSLAAVLILALLLYAFRRARDILLIALSVLWGWLFALGAMAISLSLREDSEGSVSMIVVGISSIIIGIAVNYPLHLLSHVQHQPDIRKAVREITKPLLVGNVTTVGAFLALVPLQSVALRDLGLFASFLLIGTILFVLVWLPQIVVKSEKLKVKNDINQADDSNFDSSLFTLHFSLKSPDLFTRLASIQIERKKWLVVVVALLTLVFGYFSLSVKFDSDISHINYMTAEQRADMARLEEAGLIASHKSISQFLPMGQTQETCIEHWNEWLERHPQLLRDLNKAAEKHGFADDAFADFAALLNKRQALQQVQNSKYKIQKDVSPLRGDLEGSGSFDAFDIASFHSAVADTLSDDFNYIGWVCSSIVFLFLWLSFRSIKLAVISFVPMAVSWIWILGIMSLLGIKFNIVNIILATFIFGQGDDYTIFMTEGCISEYVRGKPMLTSYKRSIILSALIMFIGIGSLIFAKHPALHSLAEVTIIGMFSVVLMAYLIPPLIFSLTPKSLSPSLSKGEGKKASPQPSPEERGNK